MEVLEAHPERFIAWKKEAYILIIAFFVALTPSFLSASEHTASFRNLNSTNLISDKKNIDVISKIHPHLQSKSKQIKEIRNKTVSTTVINLSGLSSPLMRVKENGMMQVYIYIDGPISETSNQILEEQGVHIELINDKLNIIQAWVPDSFLDLISDFPNIRKIDLPRYAITNIGSVTTEGDAVLRADELRALGITGANINVGVISNGIEGLASAQSTSDLPSSVSILMPGSGAEGTAMLEIIHDLAPGASLGFCGVSTSLDFMQCITSLKDTFGADIIVDDVKFLSEPYFEDGPVAQAVSDALSNGVIYVSAAGNEAQLHYEFDYVANVASGQNLHDFGVAAGSSSDTDMDILLSTGASLTVFLQWSDQFGVSANDYDLLLFDESSNLLSASITTQDGDDDPIEALTYTNSTGASLRARLEVNKASGSNQRIEIFFRPGFFTIEEYNISGGSITGHQAVQDVLAVAAINASDPGNNTIAPYSSHGPAQIIFPTIESRSKPNITAIDGVTVTGAGGFSSPFFGTSAAAPHVAGVIALLKSAFPSLSRIEITEGVILSAVDLGDSGIDSIYGVGRLDAFAAYQSLLSINASFLFSSSLPASRSVLVGNTATAFATILNPNLFEATDCSISPITNLAATFFYQTTDPNTNALIGTVNTPVSIAAGSFQTYLFAFTPTATINPVDIELRYDCTNTTPVTVTTGLNTLLLSASNTPVPDIIALGATLSGDGIVNIPVAGTGILSVATSNIGASGLITVSADTGSASLPVSASLCQTDSMTGMCLSPPNSNVILTINSNDVPTFAIFINSSSSIPFDPSVNRIFVRFTDDGGIVRGATSAAITTQQ